MTIFELGNAIREHKRVLALAMPDIPEDRRGFVACCLVLGGLPENVVSPHDPRRSCSAAREETQ